jgi:hypothetical protein
MTQASRTTETINRDNAAIREIMHTIKELTVPDRATLAVGLLGHLATMMNRNQMTKLMAELQEEVARVQDVPPARQRDNEVRSEASQGGDRADARDAGRSGMVARSAHDGVGQAGRGEFRARELL